MEKQREFVIAITDYLLYSLVEQRSARQSVTLEIAGSNPVGTAIWLRDITVIIPDCLSGNRGSIPRVIAKAEEQTN